MKDYTATEKKFTSLDQIKAIVWFPHICDTLALLPEPCTGLFFWAALPVPGAVPPAPEQIEYLKKLLKNKFCAFGN